MWIPAAQAASQPDDSGQIIRLTISCCKLRLQPILQRLLLYGQPHSVSQAFEREGWQVLDLCTGTGDAALRAAEAVGPAGSVLGVDISESMLASV